MVSVLRERRPWGSARSQHLDVPDTLLDRVLHCAARNLFDGKRLDPRPDVPRSEAPEHRHDDNAFGRQPAERPLEQCAWIDGVVETLVQHDDIELFARVPVVHVTNLEASARNRKHTCAFDSVIRPVDTYVLGEVELRQKLQKTSMTTTDFEDPRPLRSMRQIAENDHVVWYLSRRVESLRIDIISVLRVPFGHAHRVASGEVVLVPEHYMERAPPLEGSRSASCEITR